MDTPFKQFEPYPNPPAQQRVRGVICSDDKGQMQIIAPEQSIVDPEPIHATTARQVRSLPPAEAQTVCAIPGFYGLPSIVHSDLKNQDIVALATETPDEYVRATGSQVHQMCLSHASFETQFPDQLKTTPTDTENDEHSILEAVDNFTTRRVQARLDETLQIPPLPDAARRIIALQQDPNHDLSDLVKIIETDPAIAARIMGWANSAFYGNGTPSNSLNDAIMRVLGFDLVFIMALGLALGATLSLPKHHVQGSSPYWLDAVYRAAVMEALSRHCDPQQEIDVGAAYLTGLLSNFGTLVVGHVFPPQYETICRIEEANPHLSHACVDQHVLQRNREVIAATLLELWDLPDLITTPVRFQYVENYAGTHKAQVDLMQLALDVLDLEQQEDHWVVTDDVLAKAESLGIQEDTTQQIIDTIATSQNEFWMLAQQIGS